MSVLAAVLLSATLLGSERSVTPPAFGPAFGTQQPHALVSDGKDFLAVWTGVDGLYATAVDERGNARPTPPRVLAREAVGAQAAWNGDAYVLAWFDQQRQTMMIARLSRDADLLEPPSALDVSERRGPMALAASPSGTLLVVGTDDSVKAILVESNTEVALPTSKRPYDASAVVAAGGFVVITTEMTVSGDRVETTVRATKITTAGAIERSVAIVDSMPNYVDTIHAASDGVNVGVAFVSRRRTVGGEDRLRMFSVDGQALGVFAHPHVAVKGDAPRVVPIPGGFAAGLLERTETSAVMLLTVPFHDSVHRTTTPLATVSAEELQMASNGSRVFGIWRDDRFSAPIVGSPLSTVGLALDATASVPQTEIVPVAISAVAQSRAQIASAGTTALLAWVDLTRTTAGNLRVTRVDMHGNRLDRRPLFLASDVPGYDAPVAVYTGQVWIVAWSVYTNTNFVTRAYMRRVSRDGAILDAEPVDLGEGGVVGASNGTVTLLIVGNSVLRFSREGQRLGTDALANANGFSRTIASNGREFLFAWNEGSDSWQWPSPNLIDVRAMRFDANGAALDGTPFDVAVSRANEVAPFVTSNGENFLVLYGHDAENHEMTVRAKRVRSSGVLADHTATAPGSLVAEGAAAYAAAYAAMPQDAGYLAVVGRAVGFPELTIEAVALDERGTQIESPLPLGTSEQLRTSVATGGRWIAYTRIDPALGNIERLFVRTLGEDGTRRRTIRR